MISICVELMLLITRLSRKYWGIVILTVPAYNAASWEQERLSTLIAAYSTAVGKIKLAPNQAIYSVNINPTSDGASARDFQDLVVLMTFTPTTYTTLAGNVGISSTNNDYVFDLVTTDGTTFNRDSIQENKDNALFNGDEKSGGYTFSVSNLSFKTKSSDNTTITVNGQAVNLNGESITLCASNNGNFNVRVWKDNNCIMGQGQMQIMDGSNVTNVEISWAAASSLIIAREVNSGTILNFMM